MPPVHDVFSVRGSGKPGHSCETGYGDRAAGSGRLSSLQRRNLSAGEASYYLGVADGYLRKAHHEGRIPEVEMGPGGRLRDRGRPDQHCRQQGRAVAEKPGAYLAVEGMMAFAAAVAFAVISGASFMLRTDRE
ncbi:hypothetical protein DPM13_09280 [Paracoccus mutanolyticus]|uniref:DNA-binding protein n=1 Tax=Paracoccus mutanolyticus TaxID=1499308 RepID=A0ABM6WRW9_9RHOB|nr:hypothetical protein DPM13_09280 [Paracoccus mutanolyticus]